jgi:TrmH family RNA methyltransferase
VSEQLFRSIAATEHPQGVLALLEPPIFNDAQLFREPALILVLDGVQDPGNAGTMIRAAEAFGATGCVIPRGSANPWNPKVLRASAGSLFRMPLARPQSFAETLALLGSRVDLLAAVAQSRNVAPITEMDLSKPLALVIGSEGHGISEEFLGIATTCSIPTQGVESLNAAMAASVVLYEAARQRSGFAGTVRERTAL